MPAPRPPEGALHIVRTLREAGHQALLAGGCVRDCLMGRPAEDWDIATDAGPEAVAGLFERTVPVGERFGVVIVVLDDGEYEVARFRREEAYLDGRHPSAVHPAGPEEDARRRDFTINGMFYEPLEDRVLDFVGGRRDVEARIVRAIGDPGERFEEDHLRMLRAVRFAARFGFEVDPGTYAAIRRRAGLIGRTSPERIRDELTLMLTSEGTDRAFEMLLETGLLGEILPEVAAMKGVAQPPEFHPEGDVWAHVMGVLRQLAEPAPTLAWGTLLHDVGKPPTFSVSDRIRFDGHVAEGTKIAEDICRRLRMSSDDAQRIRDLVAHHMRFMDVQRMRPSRLKRLLREPFFEELLELHRIDCLASHGDLTTWKFCRQRLAEVDEEDLRPPRLLNGHDLIAMGFEAGPALAEILTTLEDEQLEGRVSTREEAEAFVLRRFDRGATGR